MWRGIVGFLVLVAVNVPDVPEVLPPASGCVAPPLRVRGRPWYNLRRRIQYRRTGCYMGRDGAVQVIDRPVETLELPAPVVGPEVSALPLPTEAELTDDSLWGNTCQAYTSTGKRKTTELIRYKPTGRWWSPEFKRWAMILSISTPDETYDIAAWELRPGEDIDTAVLPGQEERRDAEKVET